MKTREKYEMLIRRANLYREKGEKYLAQGLKNVAMAAFRASDRYANRAGRLLNGNVKKSD